MRTQPIAARTVAKALVKLATDTNWSESAPVSIPEIAGPREENLVDAARVLVSRNGNHLRIEEVEAPEMYGGDLGANGGLLPSPGAVLAGPTFEEWLEEEYTWSRAC